MRSLLILWRCCVQQEVGRKFSIWGKSKAGEGGFYRFALLLKDLPASFFFDAAIDGEDDCLGAGEGRSVVDDVAFVVPLLRVTSAAGAALSLEAVLLLRVARVELIIHKWCFIDILIVEGVMKYRKKASSEWIVFAMAVL